MPDILFVFVVAIDVVLGAIIVLGVLGVIVAATRRLTKNSYAGIKISPQSSWYNLNMW